MARYPNEPCGQIMQSWIGQFLERGRYSRMAGRTKPAADPPQLPMSIAISTDPKDDAEDVPMQNRVHARRERLDAIAARGERLYHTQPQRYRRRVVLLALLGYFAIAAIPLGLLALSAAAAWLITTEPAIEDLVREYMLWLLVLPMIWILTRWFQVRVDPPAGRTLTRSACPALFADIDAVRRQLGTREFDAVVLVEDCAAQIVQTPPFALLGRHRSTLVLGLELLLSQTRHEACALLAHDTSHLSREQGRFTRWTYQLRDSWRQYMHALGDSKGLTARVLRTFFDWYAPYFSAYTFALARECELFADRVAARVTNIGATSAALINAATIRRALHEQFWKGVFRRAEAEPNPPEDVYGELAAFIAARRRTPQFRLEQMRMTLHPGEEPLDSHPAIKERLAALDANPCLHPVGTTSAASAWLGETYQETLHEAGHEWQRRVRAGWSERHRNALRAAANQAAQH